MQKLPKNMQEGYEAFERIETGRYHSMIWAGWSGTGTKTRQMHTGVYPLAVLIERQIGVLLAALDSLAEQEK